MIILYFSSLTSDFKVWVYLRNSLNCNNDSENWGEYDKILINKSIVPLFELAINKCYIRTELAYKCFKKN